MLKTTHALLVYSTTNQNEDGDTEKLMFGITRRGDGVVLSTMRDINDTIANAVHIAINDPSIILDIAKYLLDTVSSAVETEKE